MELTVEASTVRVSGRFDAHECPRFRDEVTPLVETGARCDIDLSGVTFLDSSALAELVRARKRARVAGGDAVVAALSDPARIILELTGLVEPLTTPLAAAGTR